MSLDSSREAIGDSLVALLKGIQDPATNQPIYQLVKLGMIFDPQNANAWCAVWHMQGQGGPAGSGGDAVGWRIDDEVVFIITTGTGPYELDSTVAERAKLHIMDVVPPALRKHFQIPDSTNPTNAIQSVYSMLLSKVDRSEKPLKFPNGHTYAIWHQYVVVRQQYNVTLAQI